MQAPTPVPSEPASSPSQLVSERDALLLLLAWAAGCIDAVSYLSLGEVFTANMTGNTVLLGLALGQRQFKAADRSAVALAGFGIGVGLGALAIGRRRPRAVPWSLRITLALILELVALVVFGLGWRAAGTPPTGLGRLGLIALSAVAMGIQSEAVRAQRIAGIATTFVTGTLTNLTAGVVSWLRTESEDDQPRGPVSPHAWRFVLPAAVWLVYLIGAVIGGAIALQWHDAAITPPLIAIALVVIIATIRYRRC